MKCFVHSVVSGSMPDVLYIPTRIWCSGRGYAERDSLKKRKRGIGQSNIRNDLN